MTARPPMSRRAFLRDGAIVTAAGATVTACSDSSPAPTATSSSAAAGTTPSPSPSGPSWAPAPVRQNGLSCLATRAGTALRLHTKGGDVTYWGGVNLGGTTPGHAAGSLSATAADYRRWFPMMAALDIRIVRVATIHPPQMYAELRRYNLAHPDAPLYLIQGVRTPPSAVRSTGTLFDKATTAAITAEITDASAAVHGHLTRPAAAGRPGGTWNADVSTWTAAWLLDADIDPAVLERTNTRFARSAAPHRGRYFSSIAAATPVEHWLAAQLDKIATAEAGRGLSVPVAVANRAATDPLPHPEEPVRADDLVDIDVTRISAGQAWPAGTFVAQEAQPYAPLFLSEQPSYQQGADPYQAYLQDLQKAAGGMPLLVSSFGVTSALGSGASGAAGRDEGFHNEVDATRINAEMLRLFNTLGLAGGLLNAWHDDWSATTWNTAKRFAPVPEARRMITHDPLTAAQWAGLVATDSVRVGEKVVHDAPKDMLQQVVFDHDASWVYLSLYFNGRVTSPVEIGVNLLREGGLSFPGGSGQPVYDVAVRMVPTMSTTICYVRSPLDPVRLDGLGREWWPAGEKGGWNTHRLTLTPGYLVPGTTKIVPPNFLVVGNLVLGSWWDGSADDFNSAATWHLARASSNDPAILRFRLPWSMFLLSDPTTRDVLVSTDFTPKLKRITSMALTIESSTPGSPITFPVSWPRFTTAAYNERVKVGAGAVRQALSDLMTQAPAGSAPTTSS